MIAGSSFSLPKTLTTTTTKRSYFSCSTNFVLSIFIIFIVGLSSFILFSLSRSSAPAEKLMSSMDYSVKVNEIPGGFQYHIEHNSEPISFKSFLENIRDGDLGLINVMATILRHQSPSEQFNAAFWECIPISARSADSTPFEFVILNAPELSKREYDMSPFREQFQNIHHSADNGIVSFPSIGKDAYLVVPTPSQESESKANYPQYMTHLVSFHKGGSDAQIANLWKEVGTSFLNILEKETDKSKKYWLSTSGMGVSWLHIRIDSRPKYYNYVEYKIA